MKKTIICYLFIVLFVGGCATVPKASLLENISIGMNRHQVSSVLGPPKDVRGAMLNSRGQFVEVWEYELSSPNRDSAGRLIGKGVLTVITLGLTAGAFSPKRKDYWLIFVNNHLAQWGLAGDWDTAKRTIYDIHVNSAPALH